MDYQSIPSRRNTVIEWSPIISNLVNKILKIDGIRADNILLIANAQNFTDVNLETTIVTMVIKESIKKNSFFTVVTPQQITLTKKILKISSEDNFFEMSKVMGLARYVRAQYLLSSSIEKERGSIYLNMQLILVKTGEIIWSGSCPVTID
ncbi:hypothetical protein [Candidatus Erwinia haradaeae]|uniref:hypothetical protein n=1 Tax=Candidatus Erwinia haradaeae TaxID=1922217 RepID=UPI0013001833|nr:hypothetical protein [Candidatus Erwinia haradaeae]